MTWAGWIFMILSVSFVYGLAGWCYWKVLKAPAPQENPDKKD